MLFVCPSFLHLGWVYYVRFALFTLTVRNIRQKGHSFVPNYRSAFTLPQCTHVSTESQSLSGRGAWYLCWMFLCFWVPSTSLRPVVTTCYYTIPRNYPLKLNLQCFPVLHRWHGVCLCAYGDELPWICVGKTDCHQAGFCCLKLLGMSCIRNADLPKHFTAREL